MVVCALLGNAVSPRDATGMPMLYSPSVRAMEQYRRQAEAWLAAMGDVDRQVTWLLTAGEVGTDPAQLYSLSQDAQQVVDQAESLARDVVFISPPPALSGLHDEVRSAVEMYLQAATLAAQWTGAPEQERYRAAVEALGTARAMRTELELVPLLRDPMQNESDF